MSCQFAVVPFDVLPICCGSVWCPANLLWSRLMSCQFAVVPFDVLPICCGPVWCPANLLWSRLVSCQFVVVPFGVLSICCGPVCCILFYYCVCCRCNFVLLLCSLLLHFVLLLCLQRQLLSHTPKVYCCILLGCVCCCYIAFIVAKFCYIVLFVVFASCYIVFVVDVFFLLLCLLSLCFFYYYCLYCCYILFYCLQRQLLSHTPKVIPPCMQYRPPVYNESESHMCLVFCRSLCYLSSNGVLCIFYVPAVHNFTRSCRLPLLYDVTGFWRSWIHCEKTRN